MARLFTSAYGLNSIAAGIEFTVTTGAIAIGQAHLRSSKYAGRIYQPTGTNQAFRFLWVAADTQGPIYVRGYFLFYTLPTAVRPIFWIANSVPALKLSFRLDQTGVIDLFNSEDNVRVGSAGPTINLNQWYCLELFADTTTLASTSVEGRVDQVTVATGTLDLLTGISVVGWGNASADAALEMWVSDAAINNTSGAVQNSWVGPGQTVTLHVAGAGTTNTFATQTGGVAGSSNNWTRLSEETPDDVTSFNGSSTLNQEDLFRMQTLQAVGTINVVQLNARFRNSVADTTAAITFEIKKISTGTVSSSSPVIPNSVAWSSNAVANPRIPVLTLYTDPDGLPWTRDTINNDILVGYKLTAAPGTAGRRIDVTKLWLNVEGDYIQPIAQPTVLNNYQFLKTGNGMSVTEGIR